MPILLQFSQKSGLEKIAFSAYFALFTATVTINVTVK
ncbi:hypothetical protein RUESEDTHA_00701 [Ruegeria sp. THAF57]|nr:hypothetical protein RUESEDTHA_00701 [Ruegeria sp. THAF57]